MCPYLASASSLFSHQAFTALYMSSFVRFNLSVTEGIERGPNPDRGGTVSGGAAAAGNTNGGAASAGNTNAGAAGTNGDEEDAGANGDEEDAGANGDEEDAGANGDEEDAGGNGDEEDAGANGDEEDAPMLLFSAPLLVGANAVLSVEEGQKE